MKKFWINFSAASIGNIFEHYDKALFAFLAPFLAPVFFQQQNPITALILTYAIMPLGLFSRPLGALIFGRLGDHKGRKQTLYLTLFGMALTTILMGSIPTYAQIGWGAPALLALGRLFQSFFASGEATGGALLILESCKKEKRGFYNSLYECSTILGILLASFGVTLLSLKGTIETSWRMLYWMGGITGIMGLIVRSFANEVPLVPVKKPPLFPLLFKYRAQFLIIALTSGFSYANYYMLTSLLNGYLPLISSITKPEAMEASTLILCFDFLILPLAGLLALRYPKEKLLLFFGILIIALAIPLYSSLSGTTLLTATTIRLFLVACGVGFSVVLAPFYQDLVPLEHRFTIIALGNAIGSQLLGTSACTISFYLFKKTGLACAPAFYLIPLGACACAAVLFAKRLAVPTPLKTSQ